MQILLPTSLGGGIVVFGAAQINGFWQRNRTANHRLPSLHALTHSHVAYPKIRPRNTRLMGPFKNVARRYRARCLKRRTRRDTMPRVYGAYHGNFPLTRVPRPSIYTYIYKLFVYMCVRARVCVYAGIRIFIFMTSDCFLKSPRGRS